MATELKCKLKLSLLDQKARVNPKVSWLTRMLFLERHIAVELLLFPKMPIIVAVLNPRKHEQIGPKVLAWNHLAFEKKTTI